jgi:hypothetical protein
VGLAARQFRPPRLEGRAKKRTIDQKSAKLRVSSKSLTITAMLKSEKTVEGGGGRQRAAILNQAQEDVGGVHRGLHLFTERSTLWCSLDSAL